MKRFVDGVDRTQALLLPDRLEDYVHQGNPVRLVDAFVDALDVGALGFDAANRAAGGRPAYHPAALLKIEHDTDRTGAAIYVAYGVLLWCAVIPCFRLMNWLRFRRALRQLGTLAPVNLVCP